MSSDEESNSDPYATSGSEYTPSAESVSSDETRNNVTEKPKRLGRKRLREPSLHLRNVRKKHRNSGKEYTTKKGKTVPAKMFSNEDCHCRAQCMSKVSEDDRRLAFERFWKIGDFKAQNAFICGLIHTAKPKCHRPRDNSRNEKHATNRYFIQLSCGTVNVCKKYFMATYQLSDGRLQRALRKRQSTSPGEDLRGKHPPVNKTPEEARELVKQHIRSFPSYESHYTRAHNPNRKYLNPDLNIKTMYSLYTEWCNTCDPSVAPVSEAMYRKIFHDDFNLHFHAPLKDTCVKCDSYKIKILTEKDPQTIQELKILHEVHLRKADKARQCLQHDKERCILGETYTFTFDLQKALPIPTLTCSLAYYKRNMYVYNFSCHDLSERENVHMYAWNETQASRGAQEIASCIRKHVFSHAKRAKHIIGYSDACGGQNRNFKMALMWLRLVNEPELEVQVIDHKFLVSGHSFLPNDRDFGIIEKSARNKVKFEPEDWYRIIRNARKKNPFQLHIMNQEEFVLTKNFENATTKRKHNIDGDAVSWLNIQWLRFKRGDPFYKIYYKQTLDEDFPFDTMDILQRVKRRPQSIENISLDKLYSGPLAVNTKKKKDIQDLLSFIPPINQDFFKQLVDDEDVEDMGPLEHIDIDESG